MANQSLLQMKEDIMDSFADVVANKLAQSEIKFAELCEQYAGKQLEAEPTLQLKAALQRAEAAEQKLRAMAQIVTLPNPAPAATTASPSAYDAATAKAKLEKAGLNVKSTRQKTAEPTLPLEQRIKQLETEIAHRENQLISSKVFRGKKGRSAKNVEQKEIQNKRGILASLKGELAKQQKTAPTTPATTAPTKPVAPAEPPAPQIAKSAMERRIEAKRLAAMQTAKIVTPAETKTPAPATKTPPKRITVEEFIAKNGIEWEDVITHFPEPEGTPEEVAKKYVEFGYPSDIEQYYDEYADAELEDMLSLDETPSESSQKLEAVEWEKAFQKGNPPRLV